MIEEAGPSNSDRKPEVYPKHVGAFFVCGLALQGKHSLDATAAEKLVPRLLENGFRLMRFSYRETAGHPSSPSLREFFQFMTESGYLRRYNPTIVTEDGFQYCRQVVREYLEHDAFSANALARLFGIDVSRLLEQPKQSG